MRISDWSSDVCSSDLAKDIVNVRIDRKRKLPVTALLYALGLTSEEILNHFYNRVTYVRGQGGWQIPFAPENWRGVKPTYDIVDAKTGEVVFPAGQKISPSAANKATKDGFTEPLIPTEKIYGRRTEKRRVGKEGVSTCR